eukprot:COSAG04_NODE_17_length_40288_cov_9.152728_2_plen_784_part_00
MMVAGLLVVVMSRLTSVAGEAGVRLRVYANSGLAGPPAEERLLPTASFALPASAHGGTFSAELSGSLLLPAASGGLFNFSCAFVNSTLGFVWVDGHLVCADGNAYGTQGVGATDSPLPINLFQDATRGPVRRLPFRAHLYYTATVARQERVVCTHTRSAGCYDDFPNNQCGFTKIGSFNLTWQRAAELCHAAGFSVAGAEGSGSETWCSDSLAPSCPKLPQRFCNNSCPGNASQTCGQGWTLEPIAFECAQAPAPPASSGAQVGLTVSWGKLSYSFAGDHSIVPGRPRADAPMAVIGGASLSPSLPVHEERRDSVQRSLTRGWGAWLHHNMLAIVKMPEAATITTQLCSVSTGACLSIMTPDGISKRAAGAKGVRVGHFAWDRSHVQFFLGPARGVSANISIEYSVGGANRSELALVATPIKCDEVLRPAENCSDFELVVSSRYSFWRGGSIDAGANSITFSPAGLPPFTVFGGATAQVREPGASGGPSLAINLGSGAVGLATQPRRKLSELQAQMRAAKDRERALLTERFGPERMGEGMAVKSAAMWTTIATPAENGGAPLMPVSRAWGTTASPHGPFSLDFSYCIYDWDNSFATLLVASGSADNHTGEAPPGGAEEIAPVAQSHDLQDGFGLAMSNLVQTVKAKTAAGFIPNNDGGGAKSEDRSEPPVAAKTTLQLVEKFGAKRMDWVLACIFDDLLDFNDWEIRARTAPGPAAGLIALGGGNMQCARYESGLDGAWLSLRLPETSENTAAQTRRCTMASARHTPHINVPSAATTITRPTA